MYILIKKLAQRLHVLKFFLKFFFRDKIMTMNVVANFTWHDIKLRVDFYLQIFLLQFYKYSKINLLILVNTFLLFKPKVILMNSFKLQINKQSGLSQFSIYFPYVPLFSALMDDGETNDNNIDVWFQQNKIK